MKLYFDLLCNSNEDIVTFIILIYFESIHERGGCTSIVPGDRNLGSN